MVQVAKTEKSKAELYREERKQRISSAAKKNAKNAGVSDLIHFQVRDVRELNHRKKYGFIPFTEELMSWLKRIAVIFGAVIILFIAAIIIFR